MVAVPSHKQSNTQHERDFVVHNYCNIYSYPCEIIFDWKDVPIIDLLKVLNMTCYVNPITLPQGVWLNAVLGRSSQP